MGNCYLNYGFIKELKNKYSQGTIIRSNKIESTYDGQTLSDQYYLDVPAALNNNAKTWEKYSAIAKEHGVTLRMREE